MTERPEPKKSNKWRRYEVSFESSSQTVSHGCLRSPRKEKGEAQNFHNNLLTYTIHRITALWGAIGNGPVGPGNHHSKSLETLMNTGSGSLPNSVGPQNLNSGGQDRIQSTNMRQEVASWGPQFEILCQSPQQPNSSTDKKEMVESTPLLSIASSQSFFSSIKKNMTRKKLSDLHYVNLCNHQFALQLDTTLVILFFTSCTRVTTCISKINSTSMNY